MTFDELNSQYDKLQVKYGAKELDSIYGDGCRRNPDICFVFMNPTARNIASHKTWKGPKAPWVGIKNAWDLFYRLDLIPKDTYQEIRSKKGNEWTEEFASEVYNEVKKHHYFITNLGKCSQVDARALPDSVFEQYLFLFEKEISLINPKVIILFGNQVSSVFLREKISVSKSRKQCYLREINKKVYPCYPVFYPVGNGRFNIDKAVEDIKWIREHALEKENIK